MNENLNLIEILKDCPKGTPLYSIVHGQVYFSRINYSDNRYPIEVETMDIDCCTDVTWFTLEGKFDHECNGECILFPSKERRDWSKFKVKKPKFDPKTLKPFDRVLIRDRSNGKWSCSLFSHIDNELQYHNVCTNGLTWKCCIPYNEETKHLVGTTKEAPKYYRYWKE